MRYLNNLGSIALFMFGLFAIFIAFGFYTSEAEIPSLERTVYVLGTVAIGIFFLWESMLASTKKDNSDVK